MTTISLPAISDRHPTSSAAADALDLVQAGIATRQDRTAFGLDRNHLEIRLPRFQNFGNPGQRPAGADTADQNIGLTVGVAPDFLSRRRPVNRRIGQVLELLRHK